MPELLPDNPPPADPSPGDPSPCDPRSEITPSTQSRLRVLDEVMEISANLMRMIQHQTQQRFEASQQACNDMTNLPWPLITEDPAGAVEKLAKSIRHTVALAEQLEHPPKAPATPKPAEPQRGITERGINGEKFDPSRMSDADLAKHLDSFERKEAPQRGSAENDQRGTAEYYQRERAEKYQRESAENYEANEPDLNRSIVDRVADICRALNLPQFPKGHPWREKFLLDLTALTAFANEYRSNPPHVPKPEAAPNDAPPTTAPPDN